MTLSELVVILSCTVVALSLIHPVQSALEERLELPYVAKDPTDLPGPIHHCKPRTVHVDLVAKEVITEIEPGKKAWIWTFNGTVPGPMIRIIRGDTVVLRLKNSLDSIEPHNIDFHAAMGPGGGAAVTEVEPGETKEFTFKARKVGAFIYHCAAEGQPWEHVTYGMYGLIQVEKPCGLPEVDKEFYIGISDWYHTKQGGAESSHDDGDESLSEDEGSHRKTKTLEDSEDHEEDLVNDDVWVLNEDDALDEHPIMYSFNGHKEALTNPDIYGNALRADQRDRVRLFVVNGGPNVGTNFHIIGTIFDSVYPSKYEERLRNEETTYIPPGSATVFELKTPVPGKYLLVDHALFRAAKGAAGYLHVKQTGNWPRHLYSPDPAEL